MFKLQMPWNTCAIEKTAVDSLCWKGGKNVKPMKDTHLPFSFSNSTKAASVL